MKKSGHRPPRSADRRDQVATVLRATLLGLAVAGVLFASDAWAVSPMPPYGTFPCTPPTQNCGGGGSYDPANDLQTKITDRSSRSTCASVDSSGNCFGSLPGLSCPFSSQWCITPKILSVRHTVLDVVTGQMRFDIEYDFPNNYCQTWDPADTWPIPFPSHNTHLEIFSGTNRLVGTDVVFEHGRWSPTHTVGCGAQDLTVVATTFCASPTQSSVVYSLAAGCRQPDRQMCPSTGVGKPINVGSGDVMATEHLFTIGQDPLSLPFTLTYHSSAPMFPALVSSPAGNGWTHPFAQTLRPEDGTNNRLYHITPEGYESEYLRIAPDTFWIAINPGELRGTITQVGLQYRLTDLSGTVTAFEVTTGNWLSTTDRWGNSISGVYTAGQLTTITDSEGRQVQLAYTSGQVTITLPDGNTWKLTLDANNNLTQVFDPMHTGATPWHTYTYTADHLGVVRLLTSIKDDFPQELEGHIYDNVVGTGTDRALTSSQAGGAKSSVTIAYNTPTTRTVTHTIDATTQETTAFTMTYSVGRWLPAQIAGPCASCGGSGSDLQVFTYDYSNHVLDKKDGLVGEQTETLYTYDGNGMMLSRTEAVGKPVARTTSYTYGYALGTPSGGAPWPSFVTSMTESSVVKPTKNKVAAYAWNSTGTPETTLTTSVSGYLLPTDPDNPPTIYTTTTTFDSVDPQHQHRVLSIAGPRPSQLSTMSRYPDNDATPNRRGRLQQTSVYTSATAHLDTQYDNYDIFGTALKVVDPNAVETVRVTDGVGRTTSVTSKKPAGDSNEPADYTTTYVYDTRDRLTAVTLPFHNQLQYAYEDGTNRLTDTIRADALGNQRERLHLTLNSIGGKTREDAQECTAALTTDCSANWTTRRNDTFSYDTKNRLASVTHSDATHVDYTYETRGNLQTVKDENHSVANTTYSYDPLNRLVSVFQSLALAPGSAAPCPAPAGQIATCYAYDTQDDLTQVTDPNANVTTYAYDDFRRMQTQSSPVSGATTYSYDQAGNLLTSTDANTAVTTRVYDLANRLTSASSARTSFTTEGVTWTYDNATAGAYGLGRLATMTDPSGSTAYAYERRGLLRSEGRSVQGNAYSLAYGYDANGNRSKLTYPSGMLVNYTFDFADRSFSASSGTTTFVSAAAYAPFGPETQISYGNGTTKTVTYDQRYRPTENRLSGTGTIADYFYTEDGAGNIKSICAANPCPTPVSPYDRTFGYDDLNRLTTATSGASLWGTGSYAYDAMGNMTSLTLGTARAATFTYMQNASAKNIPKLSSVTETGPGTRSVSYDAAGNESAVGPGTFSHSPRNLLAAGDGNTYAYDGRGLRAAVTTSTSAPVITGFNPTSGPTGTVVTISGQNFTAAAPVAFNGTSATTFTVDSDIQITATVPSAATSGPISVTTSLGTGTSATSFMVQTPPGPPTAVTATAAGTSVAVTWVAPGGQIDHYEVWRLAPSPLGTFVHLTPDPTTTTYTDQNLSASTAYVYKVIAVNTALLRSPDSNRDLAYTGVFIDDPLVANATPIRAQHILNLRQAVAAARQTAGLSAPVWTDLALGVGTLIRAIHVSDLRLNLNPALTVLVLSTPTYTDNPLISGVTIVKAVHIQEIRNRLK